MIDVVFTIGALDLHARLSTYQVDYETEYQETMTAIDGTEYGKAWHRPVISFSLYPLTDAQSKALYDELKKPSVVVSYTDPHINSTSTATMRLTTNIEAVFGLRSVDGNRYYKGGTITLRQRTVR